MARQAIAEAMFQAGFWDGERLQGVDPDRIGCTFSASKPLFNGGGEIQAPEVIQETIARQFGFQGEQRNVVAACATGAYAAALGASWIEQDLCDVVLTGSVEPPIHPLFEAGFHKMGVISREPAMRPFDRRRSGFVPAAGAGTVILESADHARARGAGEIATLSGWGCGADAHSAVAFNSNGEHIAAVIRKALTRAGLPSKAIHHVNAHGTATSLNDWIETQALIKSFNGHAQNLMISATKSSTGHLLGAAGSVELVLTVQALRHQFVPPTLHLDEPDPTCPLDYTPRHGHSANLEHAMSLSFGFGGPIGALIVSRS
jgi:3-oxoacyl-[acyl-carrier-protein] synthase II